MGSMYRATQRFSLASLIARLRGKGGERRS